MAGDNLNHVGEMSADDLLAAIESRPQEYAKFIELLALAWDDGCEAGGRAGYSDDWYKDTDTPHWSNWPYDYNPYRKDSDA